MLHSLKFFVFCLSLAPARNFEMPTLNRFTSSVYRQVSEIEPGNFVFSTYSAASILTLIFYGAERATREEIRALLNLPRARTNVRYIFRDFRKHFSEERPSVRLLDNRIYVNDRVKVNRYFNKTAFRVFGSNIEKIDLRKFVPLGNLNQRVESQTQSTMSLLGEPVSVFINNLYFRGNWSIPFSWTDQQSFFLDDHNQVDVEMMHLIEDARYYESDHLRAKFLELPFQGEMRRFDVTFTAVLPDERDGLPELEHRLDEILRIRRYSYEYVNVLLPKFKIASGIDFKEILLKMGVGKMFSDGAHLDGILTEEDQLRVDQMLQMNFIDVNENGVEVASSSVIDTMRKREVVAPRMDEKVFRADHPFLFYITCKKTILFLGRVVNPLI